MLQQIFGGIGQINIDPKHESSKYTIIKLNDLKIVIIPHFEKYPLVHFFYSYLNLNIFLQMQQAK
jgi:hypothetical protein